MKDKPTPEELESNLSQFTGTQSYHRWSILFPNMVLSDGAKYLAEAAGAYWLMDLIGSHLPAYRKEGFALVRILHRGQGQGLRIKIEDGNDNTFVIQDVEWSDFPLANFKLYVQESTSWVIFLPSEY